MKKILLPSYLLCLVFLSGCSAEVGSQRWCDDLKAKPEGDWTLNEAKAYAKHCLFK